MRYNLAMSNGASFLYNCTNFCCAVWAFGNGLAARGCGDSSVVKAEGLGTVTGHPSPVPVISKFANFEIIRNHLKSQVCYLTVSAGAAPGHPFAGRG